MKESNFQTEFDFFIPETLPGMNEIINTARGNKFAAADQKITAENRVITAILLRQRKTGIIKFKLVDVIFRWIEKNRRRDPDNITAGQKFILDAMVREGIIPNDGWKNISTIQHRFEVDKEKPGVRVSVLNDSGPLKSGGY